MKNAGKWIFFLFRRKCLKPCTYKHEYVYQFPKQINTMQNIFIIQMRTFLKIIIFKHRIYPYLFVDIIIILIENSLFFTIIICRNVFVHTNSIMQIFRYFIINYGFRIYYFFTFYNLYFLYFHNCSSVRN